MSSYRTEKDSLGTKQVPSDAYYGIQTLRALENFPVSGLKAHPSLIRAYASIKKACALANSELGLLDKKIALAITKACDEILEGKWPHHLLAKPGQRPEGAQQVVGWRDQFVIDVFQAGAGTSFNMNMNEVIANRALEILGKKKGNYKTVHPNDHVNMAQSTNDTYPTATHLAALLQSRELLPVLHSLEKSLLKKSQEFKNVLKSARTHLQDAVPITLGQEFKAYAEAIQKSSREIQRRGELLEEIALGGTAAGTGANTAPGFREKAVAHLGRITGLKLKTPSDARMALQSHWPLVAFSNALKELALELIRIANDLRLLASGPTTGFAEIILPAVQPGSSIMPGKVNPSLAECLNMICFQIIGNSLAVDLAAQAGQLDLNVMTPLTAHNLITSTQLFINFLPVFSKKCIQGIKVDREKCEEYFGKSLSLAALLNPKIGYAKAAEVFKEALSRKKTIREVVLEKKLLTAEELNKLFDPQKVTGPLN